MKNKIAYCNEYTIYIYNTYVKLDNNKVIIITDINMYYKECCNYDKELKDYIPIYSKLNKFYKKYEVGL